MSDAFGRPRRIAVLGGGSEIGQAIVSKLVAQGGVATVVLAGRTPERPEAPWPPEVRVEVVPFDALVAETHASAIEAIFAASDDVDVFVVAVGLLGSQSAAEHDALEAAAIASTNYAGLVPPLTLAAQRLAGQGHGTMVVLSSVAAQRPRRSNYVYGAAKAGLDAFAQGLQLALAGTGAHVLLVRPGFVRTRMTAGMKPPPFTTTAEAVADAVARGLDGQKSDIIWVPGVLRYVMWIVRALPAAVVRKL